MDINLRDRFWCADCVAREVTFRALNVEGQVVRRPTFFEVVFQSHRVDHSAVEVNAQFCVMTGDAGDGLVDHCLRFLLVAVGALGLAAQARAMLGILEDHLVQVGVTFGAELHVLVDTARGRQG